MSVTSVERRRHGVKGMKLPGRPGRFDPSEPLHMTTRRKARHPTVDPTPSINGSVEGGSSPRASLDGTRPATSCSQTSQVSPSTNQLVATDQSGMTPSPQSKDEGHTLQDAADDAMPHSSSSAHDPLANMRKRKRETPSPPTTPIVKSFTPSTPNTRERDADDFPAMEVNIMQDLEDQLAAETAMSDEESEFEDARDDEIAVNQPSIDVTPAISRQPSPGSSMTDGLEISPQKLDTDNVDVDMPDASTDLLADAAEVDDGEDLDETLPLPSGSQPTKKIGGRRRRAIHPIRKVELSLRRQLEVKKAFRTMAREGKTLLAELSQRTLDDLTTNPNAHTEAAEYEGVQAKLDMALQQRKKEIQTQHKLNLEMMRSRLAAEQEVRRQSCLNTVRTAQDETIIRLQYDFLAITRAAQPREQQVREATADEDDIIPRPKHSGYRFRRGEALDPVYDSRSRLAMETESSIDDLECRLTMRKMLAALSEEDRPDMQLSFAIKDSTTAAATVARSEEVASTKFLAAAANEAERAAAIEAERLARIQPIRNEDAVGLQVLSDLCTRPSIKIPLPGFPSNPQTVQALLQQSPAMRPISPPLHPPIAVEMSPRAKQIFKERYEGTMGPPRTPRQVDATFGSPFGASRSERPVPSPTMQDRPPTGLPQSALRRASRDEETRIDQSPMHGPSDTRSYHESPSPEAFRHRVLLQSPTQARPGYDHIHAITGVPDRRAKSLDEPPVFGYAGRPLLQIEQASRVHGPAIEQFRPLDNHRPQEAPWSRSHGRVPSLDRPLSPRTAENRGAALGMTTNFCFPMQRESNGPGHSRHSSVSIKGELRSEGSEAVDRFPLNPGRTPHDENGGPRLHTRKTTKVERLGQSRRKHARQKKDERLSKMAINTGAGAATSPPDSKQGILTPGPAEGQPPRLWDVPQPPHRLSASSGSHPLPPAHTMPPPPDMRPYNGMPLSAGLTPPHQAPDLAPYHHNSFSAPHPPNQNWHTIPRSPLCAVPHPQAQPGPPGVDRYQGHHGFVAPPPPPLPNPFTHHNHPSPLTPHPQGYGGPQFGGPALAPASADPRFGYPGFRPGPPGHLPAFAQQRGQVESSGGSNGGRKRTFSDTGVSRSSQWKSYVGPPGSRETR
ncbi:hypothetical protein LTR78_009053 [Recurvomyces mirabilis]|uniref:Uncharacterized protein n=1 Tax=Recurvomyces mirabilis TaxID=574656 RepID=A0AAE0WHI9_9PEZI|nr:hypothetical protein LTR78_009053 [Recurvomyces mirabilis]KAK5150418.1 hypothetical protein LTS14_010108 [Recurvomyces mirabilis]